MAGTQSKPFKYDRSIVEGPIRPAVWKLAWPTMLQNVIAGLQGMIDHAMVGHFVGYTANAAIGVSWQIVLVVIVFAASVFSGMGVLVARFAGANEPDKVNRVVYQAFLTAAGLSVILGALGWLAAPTVPKIGISTTLKLTVSTVMPTPSFSGVCGSPAARNAPLSMKNIIMPMMPTSIVRRNGSASS